MKITALGAALALQALQVVAHPSRHSPRLHKRAVCQFPDDLGLVAIDPSDSNEGWATGSGENCRSGNHCPYACPSGQLTAQWDPSAKFPSKNGGLYCDGNGRLSKPFPDRPYCKSYTTSVQAQDTTGKGTAFCLYGTFGDQPPLIPVQVAKEPQVLAISDSTYWEQISSVFYINKPGTSAEETCSQPADNSPFILRGSKDKNNVTYVSLEWNPTYVSNNSPAPNFKVSVNCAQGKVCNGLPCASSNTLNKMSNGSERCVVSFAEGSSAIVVIS